MKKNFIEKLLPIFASLSCLFLLGIVITLFSEGLPVFKTVGFFEFIFGKSWHPTSEPPEFGILSLILASLGVTALALAIAIPLSLGSAIYIAELASPRMKEILKPIIELLAGIPSVVYGLFGMIFLAPLVQNTFNFATIEINGHNMREVLESLDMAREIHSQPTAIIAHTTKGKGVSFMENKAKWHGLAPNDAQYAQAIDELKGRMGNG